MKIFKEIYKQPIEYLLALILVYGNGSWLQQNYNMPFKLLLLSILIFYLFYLSRKKELTLINPILVVIPIFCIGSTLINYSDQSNVKTLISTLIILLIISMYSYKSIILLLNKYAEIIYGLILISLFILIAKIIYPPFISKFPFNSEGFLGDVGYYNLLVYTERPITLGIFRIQSIFWEPGAWAVNQFIAFVWYMLYKQDMKKYYIFAISLIVTFSTTGIILLLIFSVYLYLYIFNKKSKRKFQKVAIIVSLITFGLIAYSKSDSFIYLPLSGNSNHTLVDHATRAFLFVLIDKFNPESYHYGSYQSRLKTNIDTMERSKDRPFIGVGMLKSEYAPFVTSVYGEIIYQLGYIFMFFWLIIFSKYFLIIKPLFAVPMIFLVTYAEAYTFGTLFILLIVFGVKSMNLSKTEILLRSKLILNVT